MPFKKRGKMPMSHTQSERISAPVRQKENNLEEFKSNKSLGPDGSYPWVLEKIKKGTFGLLADIMERLISSRWNTKISKYGTRLRSDMK